MPRAFLGMQIFRWGVHFRLMAVDTQMVGGWWMASSKSAGSSPTAFSGRPH